VEVLADLAALLCNAGGKALFAKYFLAKKSN